MRRWTRVAIGAGVVGLVLAAGAALWGTGVVTVPGRTLALADAQPAYLDTVSLRGRRVEASLNGTVADVGDDGRVELAVGDGVVALRFEEAPDVAVEDRLLAVGRVRSGWGDRYVAVEAWSRVTGSARPPAAAEL